MVSGASGDLFTVTSTFPLGDSQPFSVCDTQYEVVPSAAVDGLGAVVLPVPLVEVVYHNRLLPVAVNRLATAPTQYGLGLLVPGAGGTVFTCTSICVLGPSQPATVWLTQ